MTTSVEPRPIPFIDLGAQQDALSENLRSAIDDVLRHGRYIHGPEVAELEQALATFCGAEHAVACANGTDALLLALRAMGLAPGDAVICPSFTFCATAEAVAFLGGIPVLADVDPASFNVSPRAVSEALNVARGLQLDVKGVVAVDLFGLPADYATLAEFADSESMWIVADGAQSFGGTRGGHSVGTMGSITTTSFFPAKPLGCYGDGGAIFTAAADCAAYLRSMRVHGSGQHKYDNIHVGMNSRLDTIQAAILKVKLEAFPDELKRRQQVAQRYSEALGEVVRVPSVPADASSSWAQYTVQLPAGCDRAALQAELGELGIPTVIYYGRPLHLQSAYRDYPAASCPVSEDLSDRVLSLPMHPYLKETDQERVVDALIGALV